MSAHSADGRRGSSGVYLQRFHRAYAAWRWPNGDGSAEDPAAVIEALRAWVAGRPEDAPNVLRLAAGAAATAMATGDYENAGRIVGIGLDASMIGAPLDADLPALTTWLAVVGARVAFQLDDLAGSRVLIDRGHDTAKPKGGGPLSAYLRLHLHLTGARLDEAAREIRQARDGYGFAADLAASLAGGANREALSKAWSALLFGQSGEIQPELVAPLIQADLVEARQLALLGLARTSSNAGQARDAIDTCVSDGLPLDESVLALDGVLGKLPTDQINPWAERLASAAGALGDQWRATWLLAVRAFQTSALLDAGRSDEAAAAGRLAQDANPMLVDGLAFEVGTASIARQRYAAGDSAAAWSSIELLLSVRAETASRLAGSRFELRARAASEPAIIAALQGESERIPDIVDIGARRRITALIDGLRSPADAPPTAAARPSSAGYDLADWLAGDRIAYQVSRPAGPADTLVLVVQNVGSGTFFVVIDGADDVLITPPSTDTRIAFANLIAGAEQSVGVPTSGGRLESLGRAAFESLPASVRDRLRRASLLMIVPDLTAGRDRIPFELLHDGDAFLGVSKILCRALSLWHALRVLEPPLLAPAIGRKAVCVSVAEPPGFPALPYAATEPALMRSALGLGWNCESLVESDAEPDTVLELAPLADVLHFACHGDSAAGAEALVLAQGARLRAIDIATRHRLRGITYLNACSLGRGRYVGGGLSRGAAYAFARAGSPTVISNLLPVADRSAAELAEAFYAMARDKPVGEALRLARLGLSGRVNPALWSTTVLIGDPFRRLDGTREVEPDALCTLFAGGIAVPDKRLQQPKPATDSDDSDLLLAAAVVLSKAGTERDGRLDVAARVAHELGDDVGEATFLLRRADETRVAGDAERHERALREAIRTLEPLRGRWPDAFDLHRGAVAELRSMDPSYQPRKLESFRFESGLTVNDRTDPAVDALLRLSEAEFEHEQYWRGEPRLVVPDLDVRSVAHNALVWGYVHRLFDTGAESAYALACASRLAWRELIEVAAVTDVHRIWAGLLYFLWGQQYVTHLEAWKLRAHTKVLEIAIGRSKDWLRPDQSPARSFATELGRAFDSLDTPVRVGSRFARAREALSDHGAAIQPVDEVAEQVQKAVADCYRADPYAAADLGAWIVGDLLERDRLATAGPEPRPGAALVFRGLLDRFGTREEGWIRPYLMAGFEGERDSGGMDLFTRWSTALL